jgi:hypothetical protein
VQADAVSGTVEVDADLLERTTVNSISGAVSVRGKLGADARVQVTSTSGHVSLVFADDAAAEYDLASFSGSIESCFGPPVEQSRNGPQRRQRFREGATAARVHANTMSGGIELCRQ